MDNIDIDVVCVAETENALGVAWDKKDNVEAWIPKSQIIDGEVQEYGDEGVMTIPEWLALEKGLI